MSGWPDPNPGPSYWEQLLRDQAEQALAEADALDEQARRDRWMAAAAEAEHVARRWGTGYWTGRTS